MEAELGGPDSRGSNFSQRGFQRGEGDRRQESPRLPQFFETAIEEIERAFYFSRIELQAMKPRRDLDQALEEDLHLTVGRVPGELEFLVRVEEAPGGAELVGAVEPALQ